MVTDRATFAWLFDVYVDPAARGAGVGTALLDAATAQLAGHRVKRVLLATHERTGVCGRSALASLAEEGPSAADGDDCLIR